MSKKIEVIYSQQSSDFLKDRAYSNPRFFTTPRSNVSKVFLVGDWPHIQAAYEAMGVPVERLDAAEVTTKGVAGIDKAAALLTSTLTDEERSLVVIPDGWATMGFTKPDGGVRALAAKFSVAPVLKKDQAVAVIEAELARRAAAATQTKDETVVDPLDVPQEAANGLTLRELHADCEAAGIELKPEYIAADLVALLAQAEEAKAAAAGQAAQ